MRKVPTYLAMYKNNNDNNKYCGHSFCTHDQLNPKLTIVSQENIFILIINDSIYEDGNCDFLLK